MKFLIFRTDRVGDFLLSLSLNKIIKNNYPDSEITLIASPRNCEYIKTFNVVDRLLILKNNLLSKIKIILALRKIKFDSIIVHDAKNRSKFISYFLQSKKKIDVKPGTSDTQMDIIKIICNSLSLKYDLSCLNFLDNRKHVNINRPFGKYIHLHFDEKWIHDKYIKKYLNIEPNENEFISFLNSIINKDKNIVITTGINSSNILQRIKNRINHNQVKIFENQSLIEIEKIVFNCEILISCHGWISHIASAKQIKQIDIIDDQYAYDKWTSHFRNYNFLNRASFNVLSQKILQLI